jgi:hypothetical protein
LPTDAAANLEERCGRLPRLKNKLQQAAQELAVATSIVPKSDAPPKSDPPALRRPIVSFDDPQKAGSADNQKSMASSWRGGMWAFPTLCWFVTFFGSESTCNVGQLDRQLRD